MTAVSRPVPGLSAPSRSAALGRVWAVTLVVFVLVTLFDPADRLLGLKLPLYLVAWGAGVLYTFTTPTKVRLPMALVLYVVTMIAVPLVSIAVYYFADGRDPFEGFQLLKAYLFISMAVLLYITRTNLLRYLCGALTFLAVAVIAVGTAVLMQPALFLPLYVFGNEYGMFSVDNRDYGGGVIMFQMYFVTSPMLAISTAYYFERAVTSGRRLFYGGVTAINLVGMVLAGSRNNLMAAVVLPLMLFVLHARRKAAALGMVAVAAALGVVFAWDRLLVLLDPSEASNSTKLLSFADYGNILSNPVTLFLGRGLGAYERWTGRGFGYTTELTYLEIVRNFGLVLGSVMLALLVYPILYAFVLRRSYPERPVIVGYLVYLVMCVSNPYLFSSMGMLVLSMIIANIAMYETGWAHRAGRAA